MLANAVIGAVGFGLWTLLLGMLVVSHRGVMMLKGSHAITDFPAGMPHGSDVYWRINRAHMNACENAGVVAAVLIAATVAGVDGGPARALPFVILGARIAQSLVHIASGSALSIQLRFSMYLVQTASLAWLGVECLRAVAP